jgi:F-type H+-transporting ATPase subunit b
MDLNATLIGQMLTFVVFILFTMKYVWPPLIKAMSDREKKIADGLAASQRGERELILAQQKAIDILQESKATAANIIHQAHSRAEHLCEEGKQQAKQQAEHLIAQAQIQIEQQFHETQRVLKNQIAELALSMAEKIVQQNLDQHQLLNKLVEEL